jgi:hypothetical protein
MKSKFFLIFLLIFIQIRVFACDCGYQGNFMKVAPKTDLVALVKVIRFITSTTMEVEIIEVLKGNEKQKRILVWGDDGNDCFPYLSEFKKEQEYLFAFNFHTSKDYGLNREFEVSICGEFWLNIEKKGLKRIAVSSNDEVVKRISYKNIKNIIRKGKNCR